MHARWIATAILMAGVVVGRGAVADPPKQVYCVYTTDKLLGLAAGLLTDWDYDVARGTNQATHVLVLLRSDRLEPLKPSYSGVPDVSKAAIAAHEHNSKWVQAYMYNVRQDKSLSKDWHRQVASD